MRASVGLIAESEKFRLALDIPQGEGSADMMHAEFGITAQSGDFKKEIKAPTTSKPLQELVDELEKLAPQVFEEEQPQDFQMDDSSFGDSTIDDAMLLDEMDAIDQEIDSLDMNQ